MKTYSLIFILLVILSCNNSHEQKNNSESINNSRISEHELDSLKSLVMKLREKAYDVSDAPKESLDQNYETLDYYLFSIVTLKDIAEDSIKMHAPLESVNKMVKKYNQFCKENIKGNYLVLKEFQSETEYKQLYNDQVSVFLKNEILLHQEHGYYINDSGEIIVNKTGE